MNCRKIRKRINMLEEDINGVDYPNEVMNKKIWTYGYLNELYERSVNGARSPKAIAHLKKVCRTIQWTVIGLSVAFIFVALIFVVKYCGNTNKEDGRSKYTSTEQSIVVYTDSAEITLIVKSLA